MNKVQSQSVLIAAAAAALLPLYGFAAQSTNSSGQPTQQGAGNPAETITFEGQGSLNKIIGSPAFGYWNLSGTAGTSTFTLNNGPGGTPVTYANTSTSSSAFLNLASANFTAADVGVNSPTTAQQTHSALRLEWHWNGTVDGSNDLINDQIGYDQTAGSVAPQQGANRGPSVANPIYVNSTNHFDGSGTGSGTLNLVTLNGHSVSKNGGLGTYNTYNASNYDMAGNNLLGGTNRVQFSFSDYKTIDYSQPGTPSPFAVPGASGYGLGNPAIPAAPNNLLGIGVNQARETYQGATIANMPTTVINPSTVSTANPSGTAYAAGPWNNAQLDNLSSTPVAANAVLLAANPGTGLSRLNKGDSQWIQTTGRLSNGLQFNTVTRDADLGQRPSFATATGIDGTWAVGVNDGGDTTTSANAVLQHSLGTIKFSGKSSDTEVYDTIAQSRMGIGVLALTSTISANSFGPVRSLSIDFNDQTDPTTSGGATDASKFISANLNTISNYQYQAVLLGYTTTVKAPNPTALANYEVAHPGLTDAQAWSQISSFNPSNLSDPTTTGIKGDTTGDVAKFLANILNSQGSYQSLTTTNDPADAFLNNSYLLPNLLANQRDPATGVISTNPNYDSAAFAKATAIYANKCNANYSGSFGKVSETTGSGSNYGAAIFGGQSPASFNGNIPITALNADGSTASDTTVAPGGNWLFGNFNQNGVRDLSAVKSALNAAKTLYAAEPVGTSGANSAFAVTSGTANLANSAAVTYTDVNGASHTLSKGDLIVLGDATSVARFDGASLVQLARGSAVSDATGTGYAGGTLSGGQAGFADSLRNGVLRKNDALTYYQSNTADATYDASGNPTNGSAFLRVTGKAAITAAGVTSTTGVPRGAIDLGSVDVASGLERFTYDPTGSNAFNNHDVNLDGVVDFNDAVLVDKFNGQDYTNLTQQLAATQQAPVSGVIQSINLANVKQSDGSSMIDNSDLAAMNTGLSGTGNTNWYGYTLTKSGPGILNWARTGGSVTIYSGAGLQVFGGTLRVAGSIDPFSDSTTAAHLGITVKNGATLALAQPGRTVTVSSISIDTATHSLVDIGSGSLDVHYGSGTDPYAAIRGYIVSGYGAGTFNGAGIVTSASDSSHGVGYSDNGSGDVTAQYALYGDANLDGKVDIADLAILATYYGLSGDWTHGDFTYDGTINIGDLGRLASDYGMGSTTPMALDFNAALTKVYQETGVAIPEPASVVLTLGMLLPLTRRRR